MTLQNAILFVACLLVVSGFVLRRAGRRRPAAPVPQQSGAEAAVRRVNAAEARLYEYARDIEATYETRVATLRVLTEEANSAAERLERALCATDREASTLPFGGPSEPERLLKLAGYSDEQIAKLLERGDDSTRRAA
jgi:hypothetical protein